MSKLFYCNLLTRSTLAAAMMLPLVSCAAGNGSSGECEAGAGRGTHRVGGFSKALGFEWSDWGSDSLIVQDVGLKVRERIEYCKHIVSVAVDGRPWESRPFGTVDHFVTDVTGKHWAFVGLDTGAVAVVDGVESRSWRDIVWPPTFSPNGSHWAYLAKDEAGAVLVVDGAPRHLVGDPKPNNFEIRDDGVAAAVAGKLAEWSVFFGGERFGPYNDVCELSFRSSANNRFAFAAMRGARPLGVVDGHTIEAPGAVVNCNVQFSPDGAHFAYGTVERKQDKSTYYSVFDGKVEPADGVVTPILFQGERVLVSMSAGYESIYSWLGVPTPIVPPTHDDYRPSGANNGGARVRIGSSLGAAFDTIDPKTIVVDPNGRVHYSGMRGGVLIAVLDNVFEPPRPPAQVVTPVHVDPPPQHTQTPPTGPVIVR